MPDYFQVESYSVPIEHTPDLCVIGGGAAGFSAAVGGARSGLDVLLIEKYGFCGGATVAGLSGTICGLYSSGENPEQIVFGFADEFHQALKKRGGVDGPVPFGRTMLVPHDSLKWKETADDFLKEAGVTVRYHTNFLKAFTGDEGHLDMLLVKGPEGQFAIQPKTVVDASGDAEVITRIGGDTYLGDNGVVQTPTMIFRMGNVDMEVFLQLDPRELNEMVAEADESGAYKLPRHHVYIFPMPNSSEVLCNMTKITYPDGSIPIGIYSEDLTFAEIEGRMQAREYARFLQDKIPAFKNAYMVETGSQIGIRQTRSIVGKTKLKNEDVLEARKTENSVTYSAWPIEAHGEGDVKIVYLENDHYDIPFETLIPQKAQNILVAGRCMCAEHEALASARVTGQCFGMGYAAGAASSLILREKISAEILSGLMVKEWMENNNLKRANER